MESTTQEMPPMPAASTRSPAALPQRLLGVWAHPDDESYLSAGLMAQTIRAGGSVTILTITDGELGFADSDARSKAERSTQRRSELRAAMSTIGVHDIRFLGVPDGEVATAQPGALISAISKVIRDVHPDLVVTFGPDGITGHSDHVANSALATEAWNTVGVGELWYAAKTEGWLDGWRQQHDDFGIWMTEEPTGVPNELAQHVIDLQGDDLAEKRSVLAEHRSQTAMVAELFGESAYREWIREETFRTPTPDELLDAATQLAVPR